MSFFFGLFYVTQVRERQICRTALFSKTWLELLHIILSNAGLGDSFSFSLSFCFSSITCCFFYPPLSSVEKVSASSCLLVLFRMLHCYLWIFQYFGLLLDLCLLTWLDDFFLPSCQCNFYVSFCLPPVAFISLFSLGFNPLMFSQKPTYFSCSLFPSLAL